MSDENAWKIVPALGLLVLTMIWFFIMYAIPSFISALVFYFSDTKTFMKKIISFLLSVMSFFVSIFIFELIFNIKRAPFSDMSYSPLFGTSFSLSECLITFSIFMFFVSLILVALVKKIKEKLGETK
ncbi:MAG: hypothetical protein PHG85_00545 [Candidatus Altiarchaeota archaeon]|nr:hypothetical protein [Candidatus Altiarchaeota archaeon]